MQPFARIILNMTGDKSHILINGTEKYFSMLRSAYKDIRENKESDYLYFAFTTLCASTLEYSLNVTILDYILQKYGVEDFKSQWKIYGGNGLSKKLSMIPSIVSDGVYCMNKNHTSYKQLEVLIRLRNRILHNEDSLIEFNLPLDGFVEGDNLFIPIENAKIEFEFPEPTNYIDSLTKESCLSYGEALGDFKKYIMTPSLNNNLSENEMVLKNLPGLSEYDPH